MFHDGHPVGVPANDGQVMGNQKNGHTQFLLKVPEQFENLFLDGYIQCRRGFVRDKEIGFIGQCHGDHHPLFLPPRQLVGISAKLAFRVLYPHEL